MLVLLNVLLITDQSLLFFIYIMNAKVIIIHPKFLYHQGIDINKELQSLL